MEIKMIEWFTQTTAGKIVATFVLSMMPVGELRLGLPYGIALGLELHVALAAALIGNMLPVPFIIIYIRRIFLWIRAHLKWLDDWITSLEEKATSKEELVDKYGPIALLAFVAIPLPGTGAWTGALVAAVLNIKLKYAVPCILLGVCIAAAIMTFITYGAIWIF